MIPLPSDKKKLLATALRLIADCTASQGMRAAYCRQVNSIVETGRQDGTKSLINKLYNTVDKTAAYLFSPTELRFVLGFDRHYPKDMMEKAKIVGQILTADWAHTNADTVFARGVFEALKYGGCIFKQWVQQEGAEGHPSYYGKLVMPWQFGLYREDENELSNQEAMCETTMLSMPEVWHRIKHLPDAEKLFKRISDHASRGQTGDQPNSFFHQVLSTSTLNTGNVGMTRPVPGGIVQLNNDPNYAIVGPEIAVPLVKFHEMWVKGEEDYVTIQVIEPDILVAPQYKRANLLIGGENHIGVHPYTLIQADEVTNYAWGRSMISDMIEPQGLLSTWADDIKRLFGLQIDKILGYTGDEIPEERYDAMRQTGVVNFGPGGSFSDLTPSMPPESIQMLEFIIKIIDSLAGLDNILSGQGEQGVRAGNHAQTLMKTASPRMRDRSLIIERQCAQAADLRLHLMEAKDSRNYWTGGSSLEAIDKTSFLLSDMPSDRRVEVDSHSGSPIFADDHAQLIAFGLKSGIAGPGYAIDNLPFPSKEQMHQELKERELKQAQMIEELKKSDPEGWFKVLEHRGGGKH